MPGLLLVVPVAVAIVLTITTLLNRRRSHPMPDGWLATVLAAGILTQVVLTGAYLIAAGPAYMGALMGQAILIPQPFVAGAVAAAVFWTALHGR